MMALKRKPRRDYFFRGLLSRGGGAFMGQWQEEGFSANGPRGEPTRPWFTRSECIAAARADGVRPVFIGRKKREPK